MARKGSELVDVKYDLIKIDHERHKAILFEIGGREVWLPRDLIEVDRDARVVTLPAWKAEQEGIDGEVE